MPEQVPSQPTTGIVAQRISCLSMMLKHPRRATQRLVEQLTFVPSGGRDWKRTLQVQIPPRAQPADPSWRVVSLGVFRRRRFPDIVARDASGTRLNFLTRDEHGETLAGVIFAKHVEDFPAQRQALLLDRESPQFERYGELTSLLIANLTRVGDNDQAPDKVSDTEFLAAMFYDLLRSFDPRPDDIELRVSAFLRNLEESLEATHYLAWVFASAGETLNLQLSYTAADSRQRPDWKPDADARSSGPAAVQPRERAMRWFRALGLAPMDCLVRIPNSALAGSYYLTFEPPANTEITYFDWATGNSFLDESPELDSAKASVHFHHQRGSEPEPSERNRVVRVYMRCSTHAHKLVAAGAALNFTFVILVASGKFSDVVGGSVQTWLLVTPTVLTAYLADQQRHYYAWPTRRQRGILWIYLAISIAFLVATSFRLAEGSAGEGRWTWYGTWSAWLLLVSSAAVSVWYGLLGYSFRFVTERRTITALTGATVRPRVKDALDAGAVARHRRGSVYAKIVPAWKIYEERIFAHCALIVAGALVAAVLAVIGIAWRWDTDHNAMHRLSRAPAVHHQH
jgi:hypothetical protein